MRDLGMEPGTPFVCFHARYGTYINRQEPHMVSLYGDQPYEGFRNTSINNQVLEAQNITELGYHAIRMGKYVGSPIETPNLALIDYAWDSRSDFMDVYLSAQCTFFIGQNSGLASLPLIFRRPVAFLNISPFSDIRHASIMPNCIFIPKKYHSKKPGRLITFRDILSDYRLSYYPAKSAADWQEYCDDIGLEILENSSEEISDLAIEMDQRINGNFEITAEIKELQYCFAAVIADFPEVVPPINGHRQLGIGTQFLRTHPELLD